MKALCLVSVLALLPVFDAFAQQKSSGGYWDGFNKRELSEVFSLDGSRNIMAEETFGIINGRITSRINYRDVGTISGLFAPPYASSDFLLELRAFGEKIPTKNYQWYPYEVKREGGLNGISISSSTMMIKGERAGLIALNLRNTSDHEITIPLQLRIQGGLNYVDAWHFTRPTAEGETSNKVIEGKMIKSNEEGSIIIGTDIPALSWFDLGALWETRLTLPPGEEFSYHIAFEMGEAAARGKVVDRILNDPQAAIEETRAAYLAQVEDIFNRLPTFSAADKRLEKYYYRSLVTLMTNQWEVPEFVLQPYFGSGAIIGGCVTLHLWEYGLPAQLFPLYDANIAKRHIKRFLKVDITRRSRFEPMSGEGAGSWYPVNQDKIIEAIYYYVLHTGDEDFLKEKVGGLSVLEHVEKNALFGDDLNTRVTLVDYGEEGENHLELRRGYPYRGILPDLNALRYLTYLRAFALTKIAGKPVHELPGRAESVKSLLKKELWSPEDKWFHFIYGDDKRDIRLTNFMYLLIGTGVFDEDIELALLSHLNTEEFLSDYGIHSIAKTDSAYDQIDIDHGGGGSYVAFPPIISQRFYDAGYKKEADDLMERHLWWGERLPYWGDSKVANFIDYRKDSPLQSDFSALSGAQTIIFGLFGVEVKPDGRIIIDPKVPSFSSEIALKNLKLRNHEIDIHAGEHEFSITVDGKTQTSKIGEPIVIK